MRMRSLRSWQLWSLGSCISCTDSALQFRKVPGRPIQGKWLCLPIPFPTHPVPNRLAGGRETLRWRARLVPCATSGVHFQPRGSCTEPEGSPASQDCQIAAGGTANLAVVWEESPELKTRYSRRGLAPQLCSRGPLWTRSWTFWEQCQLLVPALLLCVCAWSGILSDFVPDSGNLFS